MVEIQPLRDLRRTHGCGELRVEHAGTRVVLMGWVHRRRDLGGLIFLDVRDRTGITQCVVNPRSVSSEVFACAEALRNEFVVAVRGSVNRRPEGTENPALATGAVEVVVEDLRLLNPSRPLPLQVADDRDAEEPTRLRYRYLDLRRPRMMRNLVLRHRLAKAVRDYLDSAGFLEIETPMLVRSTPEGARDFLVPSRIKPGAFYALPQSPQLFKQLLMVSGVDRYFQIARCFRDEDLRADRQLEFTQVDLEMSYVGREEVLEIVEQTMAYVFRTVMGRELALPFPRLPYPEAMERYGTDKPDLRYGMELADLRGAVEGSGFRLFEQTLREGGVVKGMAVPGRAQASRKEQGELEGEARACGLDGLSFVHVEEGGVRSRLEKFLGGERLEHLARVAGAAPGDLVVVAAGPRESTLAGLGQLRGRLARRYGLVPEGRFEFLFVVDFPLFSYDPEANRLDPEHHPFTSPHPEDWELLDRDPLRARSAAYDLVLNGHELASGSVRIHRRELQEKVLGCIGMGPEEFRHKFGFLLEALEYGAPPHGGIAIGFDRLVALCAGEESIREVIGFPKNTSGACMLTGAPVEVDPEQLELLGLRLAEGVRT